MVECEMLEIQDEGNSLVKQTIQELRKQRPSMEPTQFHMDIVEQLFERINDEISKQKPKKVIPFIVSFLCENYPEHLHGFAKLWKSDPELESNRTKVLQFFNYYNLPVDVACNFTDAGFDTLDTILTLNKDSLADIESYSDAQWLPGHKIRLLTIFDDIQKHVDEFKRESQQMAVGL